MLVGRASRDALQDRVLQLVNEARVRGQRCGDAEGSKRGHVYWVQSFATPLPAPR